jgi:hypothetical protein
LVSAGWDTLHRAQRLERKAEEGMLAAWQRAAELRRFPPGTATVESAFAITGLATWRPLAPLVTPPGHAVPAGQL